MGGGGGGWVEKNRSMSIQNANDDNMSNLSDRVGYFLASSANSQVCSDPIGPLVLSHSGFRYN